MARKIFDYRCDGCDAEQYDVLTEHDEPVPCQVCEQPMTRKPPYIGTFTKTPGRSAESRTEYQREFRAKMEKRSDDYDKSPRGRAEREAVIHRRRLKGDIL